MPFAFPAVLTLYLIATLFYILRLLTGQTWLSALALRVTVIGALVQTAVLGWHLAHPPQPLALTYLDYFQFSALFLAVVFVALCFAKKFYGSGPFFLALISVFCILSLTLRSPYTILSLGRGGGYLVMHLVCIFLSLSVFALGLVTAVMFLLSEYQIRHKKFAGIVARFPALADLEDVHYKSLYVGFILLTLTIITGAGYEKMVTGHYLAGDPKQILSLLCWFVFAVLLNLRVQRGWQGHKGVVLSFVGLVGMILLFFVGFAP